MAAWILFAGTVQAGEQPKLIFPDQIAKVLRQDLPKGWTLKSDGRSIVITRDEQLTLMGTINRGFIPSLPISSNSNSQSDGGWEEYGLKHGFKNDYIISIVFKPRMTDQQYLELKAKRDAAIKKI